jgi:hypothetical protein
MLVLGEVSKTPVPRAISTVPIGIKIYNIVRTGRFKT